MIAVIGDFLCDIDTFLKQVKFSPDFGIPVAIFDREEKRVGGAGAVVEMIKGLNVDTIGIGSHVKEQCIKQRFFIDNKPTFRKDIDVIDNISIEKAQEIVFAIPDRTEYVIVSDYGKGAVTRELWDRLLQTGKKLIVDPTVKKPLNWYKGAWAILPNSKEAQVDSISSAIDRCVQLLRTYPHVLIKLGEEGMVSGKQSSAIKKIPGKKINLVDVCGAGDMVAAALTSSLSKGNNWFMSCEFANIMAAKKCEQFGATPVRLECPISI